ncbi:hypothetical protein [Pedobacter nutrimenti]|uniref:hypothetical protein n=1 Tax=Pedobacter nutrimenti TaxID=1241337 RepID=UPI00292DB9AC|nr:hypothetical protein [Pedobacter nutrimenti]
MKPTLYALLLAAVLFGCSKNETSKVYKPKVLTAMESFNEYGKGSDTLGISKMEDSSGQLDKKDGDGIRKWYSVKFLDTLVQIQVNPDDPKSATDKFAFAEFINTAKTCALVQIADQSGLAAPVYIVTVKNNKVEVVSLYRPSNGPADVKFTKGITRVGNAGYIINNDFYVTRVYAKAYLLKRQNPDQRIQGDFVINSSDISTFVFLVGNSLYELHYPTGEVFLQPVPAETASSLESTYDWIQQNCKWVKNAKGISFLKAQDPDRIVDIKEFK